MKVIKRGGWALFAVFVCCQSLYAASDRLSLNGPLVQGGLVTGRVVPGSRVTLDGKEITVTKEGIFLLGFDRDAQPLATLEITYPDGLSDRRQLRVERRNFHIQRIDGLPPRKVTPSAEDLQRIRRENALIRKARARRDMRTDFLAGFIWPARGRISGVYGSQRILNGKPRRPHFGVDVAGAVGDPVVAPAPGIVTLVHRDMFFSGGTLLIDHGLGLTSAFLHLSRIVVKEGERVRQGQKIAEIGATGRVTGPHLDWRMNLGDIRVDPQLLAGPMPESEARAALQD
ncbi:MAG: M23 family metallopeptidase [Gammaproteobacteria bacterium]